MRILLLVITNVISCLASGLFVVVAWKKINLITTDEHPSIDRQLQQDCCGCVGSPETLAPVVSTSSPVTLAPVDATAPPTAAPVTIAPSTPTPMPLKITRDDFGVADQLKVVLDPYVPVELVDPNDNGAHVIFKLDDERDDIFTTGGICEPGGYTFSTKYASFLVEYYIRYIMEDMGVEARSACDEGYLYDYFFKPQVSCCTAEQLTNIGDNCGFKGRKEEIPPCWSPPDTTPVVGAPLIKVKFLVNPDYPWTDAGLQKKLDEANRVVASSVDLPQVRFVLYSQGTSVADFGTNPADETIPGRLVDYRVADSSNGEYDVLLYVFSAPPQGGLAGVARGFVCDGSNPVAMATLAAPITVAHELMHLLGAVHDSQCNDYIVSGDLDSGMGACNIAIMLEVMEKFDCLDQAQ